MQFLSIDFLLFEIILYIYILGLNDGLVSTRTEIVYWTIAIYVILTIKLLYVLEIDLLYCLVYTLYG
jgi:hypothetical protein